MLIGQGHGPPTEAPTGTVQGMDQCWRFFVPVFGETKSIQNDP